MTRAEVGFSPLAEADLDSILNYIANDSPHQAIRFIDTLRTRIVDFLSITPNAGMALGRFRYTVFGNYVVVYAVDERTQFVRILLVSEGHRAWRRLLKERG